MRDRTEHLKVFAILALTTISLSVERLHADELLLPKPTRLVFDTAHVLDAKDRARLEARLERLRDSGLAEAIIYLAPSIPEQTVVEELTLRSANAWRVGDATTNNGLVLFAFIRDRTLRIEVGRGLEARISNAAAKTIIDEHIAPAFRKGKYAEGLDAAMDQLEPLIRGESPVVDAPQYVQTRLGATRRIAGPANVPRVRRRVNPHYPDEARRARTQGMVDLEVLIDSAGRVADVTVTNTLLPHGLSEAAVNAVRQWVFEPVVDPEGRAIPALVDLVINFRLGPGH